MKDLAEYKRVLKINRDLSIKHQSSVVSLRNDVYLVLKARAKDGGKTVEKYFNDLLLSYLIEDIVDDLER